MPAQPDYDAPIPKVTVLKDLGTMGDRRGIRATVEYTDPNGYYEDQITEATFYGPSDGVSSGPVLMGTDELTVWVSDAGQYGAFGNEWVKRFYAHGSLFR